MTAVEGFKWLFFFLGKHLSNTGELLSSGSSIGSELTVYIEDVSTKKVNLMIDDAGSAPEITEMEIYNSDF